jgi:hypothetical protein
MALQWQLSETPSLNDFIFKNYSASTDIGVSLFVMVDTTAANLINATTINDAVGIALPTDNTVAVLGVTMETARYGQHCRVRTAGIAAVTASATVTPGQFLMTDSAGKCLPQTAGKVGVGTSLTGGASGDKILVLLSFAKNA